MAFKFHPLFGNIKDFNESSVAVKNHLIAMKNEVILSEYELSKRFLQSYIYSSDTFKSYRREVERLLQWCWFEKQMTLKDLGRNSFEDYLNFAFKPPFDWIATKSYPRFSYKNDVCMPNKMWKPFLYRLPKAASSEDIDKSQYSMTASSKKALIAGCSTYFTYLTQEGYLDINPAYLLRQKSRFIPRDHNQQITRKLTDLEWDYVINGVLEKINSDIKYERHLFILSLFYLLGVRISEISRNEMHAPIMGDFYHDQNNHWWFRALGKGNKIRDIAVPNAMLDQLKRYRLFLGLTALPMRDEKTALLRNLRNNNGLGIRQVRLLVQESFDQARDALLQEGKNDAALDLMAATVHWIRHTAISADVKIRPREHVRDDAGHESVNTTDRYIDIEREERHKSAQSKKLYAMKNYIKEGTSNE
jgi:site-specific recombinase XerD